MKVLVSLKSVPSFEVEVKSDNLVLSFENSDEVELGESKHLGEDQPYTLNDGKNTFDVYYTKGKFVLSLFSQKEKDLKNIYKETKSRLRGILDKVKESRENEEDTCVVDVFERIDFNEELSTKHGFGFQDLKPHTGMILEYLTSKYDVILTPVSMNPNNFSIEVTVKIGEKEFELASN
tara:strand:+ start:10179 stop:10712 length:534 start_codon:yes stop_codon:yes gene_type:complete